MCNVLYGTQRIVFEFNSFPFPIVPGTFLDPQISSRILCSTAILYPVTIAGSSASAGIRCDKLPPCFTV